MALAQAQRIVLPDPRLAVSKRFGMYKDEENKVVRAPQVAVDETLRNLKEAWMKAGWLRVMRSADAEYLACVSAIGNTRYTSKDVGKFSMALAEFKDERDFAEKAGYFLSALVNNCAASEFVIVTSHLDRDIHDIGWDNTKDIKICGDVGRNLGMGMKRGRIIVEGNAGPCAGSFMENGEIVINGDCRLLLGQCMRGGKITVKGNAGDSAGEEMKSSSEIVINGNCGRHLGRKAYGGKITVMGNAGDEVGEGMCYTEIRIEGEIGSVDYYPGDGKIYHKGKLIFPKEDPWAWVKKMFASGKGDGDAG